ncbi:hypothetical protein BWQ96_10324 [Gracilariopsis chorda]|uniref:Uncharacterized protein n=1 Tax=Gracilariopsis chorda TaxID=448386 RepID=A0A2V3ID11_9FLOR|nr:hypothetical protein BWQ96_10324 [Gracilariopsis chorda]|eukprot:PXF39973.1 hypothetical protein BWQ96_10324 [Gracilariopsis chorda]
MEDRRKAWNSPPLRRILSLPSVESENIVLQEQNLLHRASTCADETQGNLRAQGQKAKPSGLRPCESGTLNVNASSQGFSGWGEPERTEDRAVPYKKRTFENRYIAESEVCNPYNNQEMSRGAGPTACAVPEIERQAKTNSLGLRDSHGGSGNVLPNQDFPLQRLNRGSGITDIVMEGEAGRKRSFLPEQLLSGQISLDTFDDQILEDGPVERQQWDSRDVRVLKGRARGPPSEKDESAASARSKNDGTMRPRTENFVETFRISEEASLKN